MSRESTRRLKKCSGQIKKHVSSRKHTISVRRLAAENSEQSRWRDSEKDAVRVSSMQTVTMLWCT